jgi:O-antigen ligase
MAMAKVKTACWLLPVALGIGLIYPANPIHYLSLTIGALMLILVLAGIEAGMLGLIGLTPIVYLLKRLEVYAQNDATLEFGNLVSLLPPALICLLFAMVVFNCLLSGEKRNYASPDFMDLCVLFFILICCAQVFNPAIPQKTAVHALRLSVVPILMYYVGRIYRSNKRNITIILCMTSALAVLAALYGIYQYLVSFPPWDRFWYSSLFTLDQPSMLADQQFSWGELRKFSLMRSPVEAAFYYAIGIMALMVLTEEGLFTRMLAMLGVTLILTALLLTYVRGVWFALFAGIPLYFLLRKPVSTKALATITAVGLGTGVLFIIGIGHLEQSGGLLLRLLGEGVYKRLFTLQNPLGTDSMVARYIYWASILKDIQSSPLLGHGMGATGETALSYGSPLTLPIADNLILKLAVELGAMGLVIFFAIVITTLAWLWRLLMQPPRDPALANRRERYRSMYAFIGAVFAVFAVESLVAPLTEYLLASIYFWFFLGVLTSHYERFQKRTTNK